MKLYKPIISEAVLLLCCCLICFEESSAAPQSSPTNTSVDCLACSYTFAGLDGQTDIECVKAVYNFSKTTRIKCEHMCMTRTVYTRNYERINSLTRGCGYQTAHVCDDPEGVYPTCEVTCTSPYCNDKNGDLWAAVKLEDGASHFGTQQLKWLIALVLVVQFFFIV